MVKRIKSLNVTFVSLLERGANQMPSLLKSEDGGLEIQCLSKADTEGLLYTLVYVPNVVDAHGHMMKKEDVLQACHSHNRNGAQLDLRHDCKALEKEAAHVVESFVISKSDERFPTTDRHGNTIDQDGAWAMVTQLESEELLDLAKAGKLNEVSLYAPAGGFELVDVDQEPVRKSEPANEGSTPMNEEERKALAASIVDGMSKALDAALAPIAKALAKSEESDDSTDTSETNTIEVLAKDENGATVPGKDFDCTNPYHVTDLCRKQEDDELAKGFSLAKGDTEAMRKHAAIVKKIQDARKAEDAVAGRISTTAGSAVTADEILKRYDVQPEGEPSFGGLPDLSKGSDADMLGDIPEKDLDAIIKQFVPGDGKES